jgi:anti-anti-sigma factor
MGELEERPGEVAIDVQLNAGEAVIAVSGEVDSANSSKLEASVDDALARGADSLVFDCSSLQFIDSAGLAVLVRTAGRADSVRLRAPSAIVRRTIEATGLAELLGMEP